MISTAPFMRRLAERMRSETNADASSSICASNCGIISETGFVFMFARNATADIVIIELTKKYENISARVAFVCGSITSRVSRNLQIPRDEATASRFGFSFPILLYIMRYGEEKKWTVFASTRIAYVP